VLRWMAARASSFADAGARARVACPPRLAAEMRAVTPPWVVSLVGQVAAVEALKDPAYYARRYAETRYLREELAEELRTLHGLGVQGGAANFLLYSLAQRGRTPLRSSRLAADRVSSCATPPLSALA
jgi:histidinol-phosphate/aromatic aminotransferase/cobyric acid decarboxylase-like protein